MFTIEYVKDLVWANVEQTVFNCTVKYAEFNEEHPSSINTTDPYPHIQEIWTRALAGEYGEILEYVPPAVDENGDATQSQPTTQGAQTL